MLRLRRAARAARRGASSAGSNGFTLVELVISVAILGLVMTAMVAMIATTLTVGKATERRLDSSNALRRVQRAFAADVASATKVVANTTAKCGGDAALIEMRGLTFDEPPAITPPVEPARFSTAVAYVYSGGKLTRQVCRGPAPSNGSTPSWSSPSETIQLVPALDAASVTCAPACSGADSSADTVYTLELTPPESDAQSFSASRRTS